MKTHHAIRWIAGLALAVGLGGAAQAIEVGGLKFDDTVKVAGKELKVNGAGVRTRIVVKVYALVLYLPEKKDTAAGVLESAGLVVVLAALVPIFQRGWASFLVFIVLLVVGVEVLRRFVLDEQRTAT